MSDWQHCNRDNRENNFKASSSRWLLLGRNELIENAIAEGSCRRTASWNRRIEFPYASRGKNRIIKMTSSVPSPFCFCFYFLCWIKQTWYIWNANVRKIWFMSSPVKKVTNLYPSRLIRPPNLYAFGKGEKSFYGTQNHVRK